MANKATQNAPVSYSAQFYGKTQLENLIFVKESRPILRAGARPKDAIIFLTNYAEEKRPLEWKPGMNSTIHVNIQFARYCRLSSELRIFYYLKITI